MKSEDNILANEMVKSGKMQEWQLYVAVLALIVAIITLVLQNLNITTNVILVSFMVVVILAALVAVVSFSSRSASVDPEKRAWYDRIAAAERLRASALSYDDSTPLKSTVLRLYVTGLRANYQFALLKRRKELAAYLEKQITTHEEMLNSSKR
jgi:hypothetical protein